MKCPKCHRPLVDEDDGPYICCADAPMQWQCGSCGKVSEGFAFPYGRCPQCGGELALRAPQEAHPDAASLTAVRMAFEIELGGRAFYQRAAADSHDEALRTLFSRFAVMEGEHMETLSRRYHIEAPDVSESFRIELAAIFGEVESRPQDPANLFRIAIALEKRAAEFFASCAKKAPPGSPEALLYKELAAEERDHASILTTEYTRWLDDKPGLFSSDPLVEAAHAARQPGTALVALNAAAILLDGHEPGRIALVCGDQEISYAELRDRVARAAAVWRSRGLVPGDRVAVKLCDGIDWVVAFLGTIWAGGVAVAVNPHIPAPEWRYILDEAGFNVIVAETAADTPEPWKQRVILVEEGRRAVAGAEPIPPRLVDEDTPAFWVHSSGTSGKPKAVVHAHRFVREIERISRERIGITKEDRLFASSRLFFSYPQTNSLYAGLKIGATVILDPRWPTAETVAETVAAERPSVLFCVPSLYRNLLHAGVAPSIAAAGVRRCVSAGEPLPASLREAWREACGIPMVDGYGASETLVLVLTALDGDDGLQASPGVEVRPVDGAAALSGAPTRLCFRAPSVSLGYLDRPAAQADSFRDGAFCPADLFVATDGGGWRFSGREDSLVKIKGRWVNLVELDERLAAGTPGLVESAAVILPDDDGVDAIAMFFVAAAGAADGVERELRHRAASLPQYQRPKWMHCIEALPRTATGKLLRRKLVELVRPAA